MPDIAHGFQLHAGRESWTVVTDFLDDLVADHADWRIGATLHVPRQRLAYWKRAMHAWRDQTDFLVADPETTRLDLDYEERGRGRRDYDYLAESDPAANRDRFVTNVIDAQRDTGATVLISPWLRHGVTPTEHELSTTIRFAEIADDLVEDDEQLFMGVEATEGVFASEEARNAMINEIVEGPELPVYLRMYVTSPGSYRQYQQRPVLEGMRDVVHALGANERPVALPQSGMCGWLMCAFGARSFGSGMAASMQRNSAPAVGGGGAPTLHWYFLPQLLGFVQAEEIGDLADLNGFTPCDCPYCDGELPAIGASFDSESAGKHFLWWSARLASEIDHTSPEDTIDDRVSAAETFAETVEDNGVLLDQRSQPSHLATWRILLNG
jgi:hypothetical protein